MLSINDYNHLNLLYDKFLKMNSYIKELVLKEDWDSVDLAIQQKDGLLRQIMLFEKPRIDLIKKNIELDKKRIKLIDLEKENLVLVKELREKLFMELGRVKKTKKLINTYEPSVNNSVSTFEINDDE